MKWMQIIVATTNPNGKESLRYYLNQMHQHYQRVGANPLGKYRIDQVVVGIGKPEMVLVVEFPHESAFREVLVPQVKKILTNILNKEVRSRLVKDRPAKNTRTLCLQQAKH